MVLSYLKNADDISKKKKRGNASKVSKQTTKAEKYRRKEHNRSRRKNLKNIDTN